eukprot:TRINITY_DN15459_c0_g1_i1.p1 TRINITY_DN15459_c0_g1~~TRINITY_DN15459_c0_g1_i1.p1  ORF type:complete len:1151 (+),score=184.68 TRINITY_DN15459_c0_g1_i1:37-3453(+)
MRKFESIVALPSAEESQVLNTHHKKVKNTGGDYGKVGEEIKKEAVGKATKENIKDELYLRNIKRETVHFSTAVAVVRGCGRCDMAVVITTNQLYYLTSTEHADLATPSTVSILTPVTSSRTTLRRNGVATTSFPDLSQAPGGTMVPVSISLRNIKEVLYTETDELSLAIDIVKSSNENHLWAYSVITFNDPARKDSFLGFLLKQHALIKPKLPDIMVSVVSEPLLNVEYAKRAISSVKLRRALEADSIMVDTEDDFANLAPNPHIAKLLRSKGDTTIKLSLRVQFLYEKNEAEKLSHILLITTSAIYILYESEREFKLETFVRVERLESAVFSTSQSVLQLHLRRGKKKDGGILRALRDEKAKEHFYDRELLIRVCKSSSGSGVSVEKATHKIQEHLETAFLDIRIERLPFRFEREVHVKSKMDLAIHAGSKLTRFLSKAKTKQQLDNEADAVVAKQDLNAAYKWLLVVVKVRVFDLIDTFTNLNIASDVSHKVKDQLIGRRLGLSLLALCAHLDLTHQLMYECILYELMSCFGQDKSPSTLFQADTFGVRLILLYVGSKADQYARLTLTNAVSEFQRNFSEKHNRESELLNHCWTYFNAITNTEHTSVFPYELQVIVAMIKRCVHDITDEELMVRTRSPINVHRCIGAFLMQRVWLPSIQSPSESGITTTSVTKQQTAFLTELGSILNHAIGYGTPGQYLSDWGDSNRGAIDDYVSSLVDQQMLGQARMYAGHDTEDDEESLDPLDLTINSMNAENRKYSGPEVSRINSTELIRRHSVLNMRPAPSAGGSSKSKPKAFNKMRDKVLAVQDSELKALETTLSSVHEALGRDTGRLLTSLTATVSRLKNRAKEVEAAIEALENADDDTPGSPFSTSSRSSVSSFREASPLHDGVKRWKRARITLQLNKNNTAAASTHVNMNIDEARRLVYNAYVTVPMLAGVVTAGAIASVVSRAKAESVNFDPAVLESLDEEAEYLESLLETKHAAKLKLEQEILHLKEMLTANPEPNSPLSPGMPFSPVQRLMVVPSSPLSRTTLKPVYSSVQTPLSSSYSCRPHVYYTVEPGYSDSSSEISDGELMKMVEMVMVEEDVNRVVEVPVEHEEEHHKYLVLTPGDDGDDYGEAGGSVVGGEEYLPEEHD